VLHALARGAAAPTLPRWDAWAAGAVALAGLAACSGRLRAPVATAAVAAAVVVGSAWSVRAPDPLSTTLGRGARLDVAASGAAVVTVGGLAGVREVAEGLELARVRRLDLIVLTSDGPTAAGVATDLVTLWPARVVAARR
jgi:hypothetical protein